MSSRVFSWSRIVPSHFSVPTFLRASSYTRARYASPATLRALSILSRSIDRILELAVVSEGGVPRGQDQVVLEVADRVAQDVGKRLPAERSLFQRQQPCDVLGEAREGFRSGHLRGERADVPHAVILHDVREIRPGHGRADPLEQPEGGPPGGLPDTPLPGQESTGPDL